MKNKMKIDRKIRGVALLTLILVGSVLLTGIASATPGQSAIPNLIYKGNPTVLEIEAGANAPHSATEIAIWDAPANPVFPVTCPLPGASGGIKWELRADTDNDGDFTDAGGFALVTYIVPTGGKITITDFGNGGAVTIVTAGGATISPAAPSGGFKWQNVAGGPAGTDSTLVSGQYELASCGTEGVGLLSNFVGTTTFLVINPSTMLTKTASATTVNLGDTVTYTFNETNDGDVPLTNVSVVDDKCSPVNPTLKPNGKNVGDADDDGILDVGEKWTFTCQLTMNTPGSITNSAIGSGQDPLGKNITYPGDPEERANVTVNVLTHPSSMLTKTASAYLVNPGTTVTYTYNEKNDGDVPLHDVSVVDDKCSPVNATLGVDGIHNVGDANNNGILDPNETWVFTCKQVITGTVTNTAIAHGLTPGEVDITYPLDPEERAIVTVSVITQGPGKVIGWGNLGSNGSFNLWVYSAFMPNGKMEFTDKINGVVIKATRIDSVKTDITSTPKTGTITGMATLNGAGPYNFTVQVVDAADPGAGKDMFTIDVSSPTPYHNSGTLTMGDITVVK